MKNLLNINPVILTEIFNPGQDLHRFLTQARTYRFLTQVRTYRFITQARTFRFPTQARTYWFITQARTYRFINQARTYGFLTQARTYRYLTSYDVVFCLFIEIRWKEIGRFIYIGWHVLFINYILTFLLSLVTCLFWWTEFTEILFTQWSVLRHCVVYYK